MGAYELQNLIPATGKSARPLVGDAEPYSAMLSGYLDIPFSNHSADRTAGIAPYIGGGVGVGLRLGGD